MSDWTAGYVTDIGYTYGYYRELNPVLQRFALLLKGYAAPEVLKACELGFGQGVSINIHAAASGCNWYGTDFNPSQVSFAKRLATASGCNAHLFDDSFAEFANRDDLPEFDSIGLHGIWSWISDENHAVVVDFVRRKLKVGGTLYLSYNTQPGWAPAMPLRHLLTTHAELAGNISTGIVGKIDGAIAFAESLFATNPLYSRLNPTVPERFAKLKEHNRQYLAHEYFNRDWTPLHFGELEELLRPAKISFAAPAHPLDGVDIINLTEQQQTLLEQFSHPVLRETIRDFCMNQQFRRDIWIKGGHRLNGLEQVAQIKATAFVLTAAREDIPLKVTGALGEATLQESVYVPLLEVMASQSYSPKTISELLASPDLKSLNYQQIAQAVVMLVGLGHAHPAQPGAASKAVKDACNKLNRHLCTSACLRGDIHHLASPVTGGGIPVGRFQQIFMEAQRQGQGRKPEDWANFAWKLLASQGNKIVKDGKTLESPEENIAELTQYAKSFAEKYVPVFSGLGIL